MSELPKIDLISGWDCYDWRNARTILQYSHPSEWQDIVNVLSEARLLHSELAMKGGNKTTTATSFDSQLYARGWVEKKFETKIVVDGVESESPTHKVDCFDVGIVVTRSTELMHWMRQGYADFAKAQGTYGSSTTHFDKLAPRILGGGAGGCPVLVFAMTPAIYVDDRSSAS